ncbi:MAG: cupin domain-containing protein [Anaerolineales bacterium]
MKNIQTSIGKRLRAIRLERSLSQRELAKMAGISTNSISLIERDEISPSVATLQNLATALRVRISFFFESEPEQKVFLVKKDQRSSMETGGVSIDSIGNRIHGQEVEPFVITLQPKTSSGQRVVTHSGHEVVYCLKGKMEYSIDGVVYPLEEGDFLLFEARLPHLWRNPYGTAAEFILILQTPGAALEPVKRHFIQYPSVTHIE